VHKTESLNLQTWHNLYNILDCWSVTATGVKINRDDLNYTCVTHVPATWTEDESQNPNSVHFAYYTRPFFIQCYSLSGKNYGKDGTKVSWWNNDMLQAYEVRAQCFVHQYNQYSTHGYKVQCKMSSAYAILDKHKCKILGAKVCSQYLNMYVNKLFYTISWSLTTRTYITFIRLHSVYSKLDITVFYR
jgi:hypothetical protein